MLLSSGWPVYNDAYAMVDSSRVNEMGERQDPAQDYYAYLPYVARPVPMTEGILNGYVIDAGTGSAIEGAEVCYQDQCTFSGTDGGFEISGLPPGSLTFEVSAADYFAISGPVTITGGSYVYHQFALIKRSIYLTDVFISLEATWSSEQYFPTPGGPQENDLDLHIWMDHSSFQEHIYSGYQGDCSVFPNICLTNDARLGSGPETIDIPSLEPGATYFFGIYNVNYYYYPDDFPSLQELDVVVRIFDDNGLAYTLSGAPPGEGDFWYIFNLDEHGVVTVVNCLTNYDDNIPACP